MIKKTLLTSLLSISCVLAPLQPVHAETLTDLLPTDLTGEINKGISNALNGLVIFTSSSSLGSGYFTFDSDDSPDTKMDVLRLMGDYDLVDSNTETFAPFLRGGVGRLKLSEEITPFEGIGSNDFSVVETSSLSGGIGVDIKAADGFFITPMFDLVYSHTENKYDYNNEFSQTVLQLFDRDIFNWDIDTLSYNPGAMDRYEALAGSVKIIPSVTYTHVFVDSIWTNSSLLNVNTSSGVLNAKIKAEIPTGICVSAVELWAVPQFSRTDLYRDAREGAGIGHFNEVSLGLIAKNQNILPIFKDFGITGGYSFAEDVTGWRIGLEAEL